MKTFCPNCGTDNEGMPGGRVTCRACTASFEVPRATTPPQPAADDPVATFLKQPASPQPPPPKAVVQPPPSLGGGMPSGYVGPPPSGFGSLNTASTGGQLNNLAVVSLVLGLVCCIPLGWVGAIITGVMAKNQIEASNGTQRGHEFAIIGIVLGCASGLLFVVGLFFNVLGAVLR